MCRFLQCSIRSETVRRFDSITVSIFSLIFRALIKEYKRRNEMMWELQTQIDSLPIKILKPILEFNGIHVWDKMKSNEAAHVIADGNG